MFENARQGVATEAVGFGQREISFHPRDVLAGDGAELFAGSEFGRQHFSQRGGKPGVIGLSGKIAEAEDGDRSARGDAGQCFSDRRYGLRNQVKACPIEARSEGEKKKGSEASDPSPV